MPSQFNISAELTFRMAKNISAIRSDIERSLKGLKATVAVKGETAGLDALKRQLGSTQKDLRSLQREAEKASRSLGSLATSQSVANRSATQLSASHSTVTNRIRQLTQQTKEATTATQSLGRQFGDQTRRLLTYSIAAAGIYSVVRALKDGVTEAIRFEREMVKLTQQGATVQEVRQMEKAVTRMSTAWGVSSKELAQAAVTFQQTGMAMKDVEKATEAVAKAALAPNFGSIKEATEGAISVMRIFNIDAGKMEQSLTAINSVAGAFASESKDLIEGVKRAGASFASAGGSLNQLLALMSTVRSTTRESAESIATGLRTIFTRMQRPATIEAMKQLNIQLRHTADEAKALGNVNLEGQFVGPYEAVMRLATALKGLRTTDSRYMSIVEELGGYRQVTKLLPMLQQVTEAQKAYTVAQYGGITLQSAAAKASQTMSVRLDQVKEKFLALTRTFVGSNAFQAFTDNALKLAGALAKVLEVATPLLPMIAAFATAKLFGGGFGTALAYGTQRMSAPARRATGGTVPGTGNSDTVPIMATPGEFVIQKKAVQSVGTSVLSRINQTGRLPGYAKGGQVQNGPDLEAALTEISKKTGMNVRDLVKEINFVDSLTSNIGGEVLANGMFHPPGNKIKHARISLNRSMLTTQEKLISTLSHELGHALDARLGDYRGVHYASDMTGTSASHHAAIETELLKQRHMENYGHLYSNEWADYLYSPKENFANAFKRYVLGGMDKGQAKDFKKHILGEGIAMVGAAPAPKNDILEKIKSGQTQYLRNQPKILAALAKDPAALERFVSAYGNVDKVIGAATAQQGRGFRSAHYDTLRRAAERSLAIASIRHDEASGPFEPFNFMLGMPQKSGMKGSGVWSKVRDIAKDMAKKGSAIYPGVIDEKTFAGGVYEPTRKYGETDDELAARIRKDLGLGTEPTEVRKAIGSSVNAKATITGNDTAAKMAARRAARKSKTETTFTSVATQGAGGQPPVRPPVTTASPAPSPGEGPGYRRIGSVPPYAYSGGPQLTVGMAARMVANTSATPIFSNTFPNPYPYAAYDPRKPRQLSQFVPTGDFNVDFATASMARASGGAHILNAPKLTQRDLERMGFAGIPGGVITEAEKHIPKLTKPVGIESGTSNAGNSPISMRELAMTDKAVQKSIQRHYEKVAKEEMKRAREQWKKAAEQDKAIGGHTAFPFAGREGVLAGLTEGETVRYGLAGVYDQTKGFLGRTRARIVGSRAYRGLAAFGGKLDSGLSRGAMFGVSMLTPMIEHMGGTAEEAVASGGTGGFRTAQVASGTLGYAAGGAFLGSFVGPVGTAIGAIGGAAIGLVSSLKDSAKQVREAELGKAAKEAASALELMKRGLTTSDVTNKFQENIGIQEAKVRSKAAEGATSFFGGFDTKKYLSNLQEEMQNQFGPKTGEYAGFLNEFADKIGRENKDANLGDLRKIFEGGNRGINSQLLSVIQGTIPGANRDEMIKDFLKVATQAQARAKTEGIQKQGEVAEDRLLIQYRQLEMSAQQAAHSLNKLSGSAQLSANMFAGHFAPVHIAGGIGADIGMVGGPDRGAFRASLAAVSAPFGRQGRDLRRSGEALDDIHRELPAIIAEVVKQAPLSGDMDYALEINRRLRGRFGGETAINKRPELQNMMALAGHGLRSMGVEEFRKVGQTGDVHGLIAKILESATTPFTQATGKMASLLTERAKEMVDGLHEAAVMLRQINEGEFKVAQAGLAQTIKATQFSGSRTGREHGFMDLISLETLQAPFRERQNRLAGADGFNPAAIGSEMTRLKSQLDEAVKKQNDEAQKNLKSDAYKQAAQKVVDLGSRIANLNDALVHLTNTAESTAAAEEKLKHVEEDRQSRLGFGKSFLMSDIGGRAQMLRGLNLVRIAHARGDNINNMNPMNQRLVLETLDRLGNATLPGLGGKTPVRASNVQNNILKNAGFGPDKKQEGQRRNLQDEILKGYDNARKAEEALQKQKKDDQKKYQDRQQELQNQFFEKLNRYADTEKLRGLESKHTAASAEAGRLGAEAKNRSLLFGGGVLSVNVLRGLKTQQSMQNLNDLQAAAEQYNKINKASTYTTPVADRLLSNHKKLLSRGIVNAPAKQALAESLKNGSFGLDDKDITNVVSHFEALISRQYSLKGRVSTGDVEGALRDAVKNKQKMLGDNALNKMDEVQEALQNSAGMNSSQLKDLRSTFLGGKGNSFITTLGKTNPDTWKTLDADLQENTDALEKLGADIKKLSFGMNKKTISAMHAVGFAGGGGVHVKNMDGGFAPKGTDTVPAMLTPGEYVIRAPQAKKYRSILEQINTGYFADGGDVMPSYYAKGGHVHTPHPHMPQLNPRLRPIVQALARQHHVSFSTMMMYLQEGATPQVRAAIKADRQAGRAKRVYRPGRPVGDASSLDEIRRRQRSELAHLYGADPEVLEREERFEREDVRIKGRALREKQREALGRIGAAHRRRYGVPVASATSLDEIRRRGGVGPVGRMATPSYTRISPNAAPVRHYAEGGSVDAGFAGTANMLAKAIESIPRNIEMSGQHQHTHHHFGLEALKGAESAIGEMMQKIVEENMKKAFRNFRETGVH